MIKACISDLDGTAVNTIESLCNAGNIVMKELGFDKEIDPDHMKQFVGNGYIVQMQRALEYEGDAKHKMLDKACKLYRDIFAKNCLYHLSSYDGLKDTYEEMKRRGIRLSILTNKPQDRAVDNINYVYGEGFFDYIWGDEIGRALKPDPASLIKMLELYNIMPDECLYIGDSGTDMQTGISAGARTVGVLWGYRDRKELSSYNPYALIEKPIELLDMID